jgi:hypothetical protein
MTALLESPEINTVPELSGTDELISRGLQPPKAKSLMDLKRRTDNDPSELLKTGYLCRGGGLLLAAPTGIGKSSFGIQAQIMFALERDIFGIKPARPLSSLYIQAENDDGDLAEMRDGVIAGLGLSESEIASVRSNVIAVHENARTLEAFFSQVVGPMLETHKPDLLWIDPALSYIGGDASNQQDVSRFLRNLLNPLLSKHNCGCVIIHHTNKPSHGVEKSSWQAGDFAYLGSGSAEWANWARAVLAIRSKGSHDVFELVAAKRGARIGWKDVTGQKAYSRLIAHSKEPGVICWRSAEECEIPTAKGSKPLPPTKLDLLALVPESRSIEKNALQSKANEAGIAINKINRMIAELVHDGALFEWLEKRPRTNPKKSLARFAQPENKSQE